MRSSGLLQSEDLEPFSATLFLTGGQLNRLCAWELATLVHGHDRAEGRILCTDRRPAQVAERDPVVSPRGARSIAEFVLIAHGSRARKIRRAC